MPRIEYVDIEQMLPARALRKESERQRVRAEYEGFVRGLTPGQAGRLVVDKTEKPATVRNRLRAAARRLNLRIQIRRKGNDLFFRLRQDAAPPATTTALPAAPTRPAPRPATKPKPAARAARPATDRGPAKAPPPPARGSSAAPAGAPAAQPGDGAAPAVAPTPASA